MSNSKILEMRQIEKYFGTNYVLKKVDFSLEVGSIHALLGENGTGKSTLMNILTNLLNKDAGQIFIDGIEVNSSNISETESKIAFIHQELSVVNDLSIYENLFLGEEIKSGLFLNKKAMIDETATYLKKLNLDIDPRTLVGDLNPSYKQITEILRAIRKDAKVIIMDEPTTALTDVEVARVFTIMRSLKEQGVSLIFISHKLNEVIEICDSYTIMRDGVVVSTGFVGLETDEAFLSSQMIGKKLSDQEIYRGRKIGEKVLELKNLSKERQYQAVNMTLHKGEIIGVTGLLGDGRSELFASVAGANSPYQGEIEVAGKVKSIKTTVTANKLGISYVPKNRKENGIIKDLTIAENITLPILKALSKLHLINKAEQNKVVDDFVARLKIKIGSSKDLIGSLSGGNQQKVVLAKSLSINPSVVILDNPTQGVDVGAKLEIYQRILDLADEGISFVILSSEFPEIQRICDRVYVMFHGQVRQEFTHDELVEENVMLISTGGQLKND